MPVVTLLQLGHRRKDRVNVHLDGEYAFSLGLDLAAALRKGQVLDEADVTRLREEDGYGVALDRALHFLTFRPRSRWEIERKLRSKDVADPVVERVIARLSDLSLVDDSEFAGWWVENRTQFRPRGKRGLRSELSARGVPDDIASEAVSNVDESELATRVACERAERHLDLDRAAFDKRLGGYLRRRGFGPEAVRDALRAAWAAIQDAADGASPA